MAATVGLVACGGGQEAGSPAPDASLEDASRVAWRSVDSVGPTVAITSVSVPVSAKVDLSGTAGDNKRLLRVRWATDKGAQGSATLSGTPTNATWAAPGIALAEGANTITVTALDAAGNATTAQTVVNWTPPPPPPPPPPAPVVYEAETGTIFGSATVQQEPTASNGAIVGHFVEVDAALQMRIDGGSGGPASVVIRHSNGTALTARMGLYLNNVRQRTLNFAPSGGWTAFGDLDAFTLSLAAGPNDLMLRHDPDDANSADIDRFSVTVGVAPPAPDTTAPTPPSGLVVSNLTCTSLDLSWQRSTDDVGVSFYDLYHDGQQIKSVNGGTVSTSITLVPGARWGLYVNARDAAGNVSQASTTLPVTVPACVVDTEPPTAPTGVTASTSGTTAIVGWSAATDNIAVTAYDIYRDNVKVGSTSGLSFIDSGLSTNTTYVYTVAARDAQANVSPRSAAATVTTGGTCTASVCDTIQVGTDTDVPWGLLSLPDGKVLYSRRDAKDIVRLDPATGAKTSVGTVPNVQGTDGEGGLLGIAAGPGFPDTDPWLYIHHTSPSDNRVVRMRYSGGTLDTASLQVLLSGIGRNKYHNGGRLRYGPDGKLYITTGDAQNGAFAQDVNNLAGKILRINPDGSIPADNPFGNAVWSYGHRNPQGLAFDSLGRLWEQEFGNDQMDETNLIERGGNYGWPQCEGTISVSGQGCATPGFIAPKATYQNFLASCSGIAIVRDALYAACLRGTRVYRWVISGAALVSKQELFSGTYGRLRTVEPTLDGNLWLTTSTTGDADSIVNNSNEKILKVILGN